MVIIAREFAVLADGRLSKPAASEKAARLLRQLPKSQKQNGARITFTIPNSPTINAEAEALTFRSDGYICALCGGEESAG